MASAIIDRLVHHAVVIKITCKSYRIKNYTDKSIPVSSQFFTFSWYIFIDPAWYSFIDN